MENDCGPILIVDDHAPSRRLVRELLSGEGYETIEAASGEQALLMAGERQPSLALLDVQLPGIGGYEVCRQLKERFGDRLPIVFLSGTRTESYDRVAGLMIGADDYIVKPFAPDELVARVWRLLVRAAEESPNGKGEDDRASSLTDRERQVLGLLADGLPQNAIAAELYISPKTVAMHIQRILSKLDVHSRAEAVAVAYRDRIVGPRVSTHL